MDLEAMTSLFLLLALTYSLITAAPTTSAKLAPAPAHPGSHQEHQSLWTLLSNLHNKLKPRRSASGKRNIDQDFEEIGELTATLLNDIEDHHPIEQQLGTHDGGDDINTILIEIIKQKEWLKASLFYENIIKSHVEQIEAFRSALMKMRRQLKNKHQIENPTFQMLMHWLKDMIRNLTKLTNSSARLPSMFADYSRGNTVSEAKEIVLPEYIQQAQQGYVFHKPEDSRKVERKCKRWRRRKRSPGKVVYAGSFDDFDDISDVDGNLGDLNAHFTSGGFLDIGSNSFGNIEGSWGPPVDIPTVRFDDHFWEDDNSADNKKSRDDYLKDVLEEPTSKVGHSSELLPAGRNSYQHVGQSTPFRVGAFSKLDITIPLPDQESPAPVAERMQPLFLSEVPQRKPVPTRDERNEEDGHASYFDDLEPDNSQLILNDYSQPIMNDYLADESDFLSRPSDLKVPPALGQQHAGVETPPPWDNTVPGDPNNSSEYEYFLVDC